MGNKLSKKHIHIIDSELLNKNKLFIKELIEGIIIPNFVIKEPLLPSSYISYKDIFFYLDTDLSKMAIKTSKKIKYYKLKKLHFTIDIYNITNINIYTKSKSNNEYYFIGKFVMDNKELRNKFVKNWNMLMECLDIINIKDIINTSHFSTLYTSKKLNTKNYLKYIKL